jgi:hypothetical protein
MEKKKCNEGREVKRTRNRKRNYETRLTVRIPMFLDGHVRQYCDVNNVKLSMFIREALQTYLVYKDYKPTAGELHYADSI